MRTETFSGRTWLPLLTELKEGEKKPQIAEGYFTWGHNIRKQNHREIRNLYLK